MMSRRTGRRDFLRCLIVAVSAPAVLACRPLSPGHDADHGLTLEPSRGARVHEPRPTLRIADGAREGRWIFQVSDRPSFNGPSTRARHNLLPIPAAVESVRRQGEPIDSPEWRLPSSLSIERGSLVDRDRLPGFLAEVGRGSEA